MNRAALLDVPFIHEVTLQGDHLALHTPGGVVRLRVERRRGALGHSAALALAKATAPDGGRLVVLPRITSGVAATLREAGVNYLDEAGNLYLDLGGRYVAWVDGRRSVEHRLRPAGLGSASYRVLAAVLIDPRLLRRSLRDVGAASGASRTTVASVRDLLRDEGHLVEGPGGLQVVDRLRLLDRWALGYRDLLRPRLMVARYALPGGRTEALRAALDARLGDAWAWGGSQGAFRQLDVAAAEDVVVHLDVLEAHEAPSLPLRPQEDGAVEVLALPCRPAWGQRLQGSVHPVLLYGELAARPGDRSLEAAAEVRSRLEFHWGCQDGA